jgi:hypothetical protein
MPHGLVHILFCRNQLWISHYLLCPLNPSWPDLCLLGTTHTKPISELCFPLWLSKILNFYTTLDFVKWVALFFVIFFTIEIYQNHETWSDRKKLPLKSIQYYIKACSCQYSIDLCTLWEHRSISVCFNTIFLNHTHIHTHTHIYIYTYTYIFF